MCLQTKIKNVLQHLNRTFIYFYSSNS